MWFQWKKEWMVPTIVGAVSFVSGAVSMMAGGVITTLVLKKRFDEEEPELLKEAIEEFREAQVALDFRIVEQDEKVERMIDNVKHMLNGLRGERDQKLFDDRVYEMHLSTPPDGWDQEKEEAERTNLAPHIISVFEYSRSETGYLQTTLTYYKGDDILCDPDETPIYNKDKVVGELKFGHGSKDESIVYIRNDTLKAEYEILLEPGYYTVQVLGQQAEDDLNEDLKHSHVRKFRAE
jgi:hypothetical protein